MCAADKEAMAGWLAGWLGPNITLSLVSLSASSRNARTADKKKKDLTKSNLSFANDLKGAANIVDHDAAGPRTDKEVVPDAAMRPSTEDQDHHVGRGGAGNEHLAPGHEHKHDGKKKETGSSPTGLADKLKAKIMGVFKK